MVRDDGNGSIKKYIKVKTKLTNYIMLFVLGIIAGLLFYIVYCSYPQKFRIWLLVFISWIIDQYLNLRSCYFKLTHQTTIVQIRKPVYQLTKVLLITIADNGQITSTQLNYPITDLRQNNMIITREQLGKRSSPSWIHIHFQYDNNHYILSQYITPNLQIHLPIYAPDDIDTCMQYEYESINLKMNGTILPLESDSNIFSNVIQYSGPKGNFYSDTIYTCCLDDLFYYQNDKPIKSIITTEQELMLTTMMGKTIILLPKQPIHINKQLDF